VWLLQLKICLSFCVFWCRLPLPTSLYPNVAQATIAGGGVIPHIHKSLINKGEKKMMGPMI